MTEHLIWDPLMVQRYNRAGPRYTSYPTAIEFCTASDDANQRRALSQSTSRPLSLYLHIPFCSHVCYYCGCNKIVTRNKDRAEPYLQWLLQEIDLKAALVRQDRVVEQLHLGGGTPTFFSDEQLDRLITHLRRRFRFSDADSADFSIEIDPRELGPETLSTLRALGFNRVSFGVQDLDPDVQKAVNRIQSQEMIHQVMSEARALGFRSINVDLIYGLPLQTLDSFERTIRDIIDLRPDRLSVFNYAHLPQRFMPQRRINAEDLPAPEEKLTIFGMAIRSLSESGYHYVGMDHFALPDDELSLAQAKGTLHRNFQGYTTHGNCDLIGFGVSSISQLGDLFIQSPVELDAWQTELARGRLPTARECRSSREDEIRKRIIMGLLCHLSVRFNDLDEEFGINSRDRFSAELARLQGMQEDGLLIIDSEGIQVTDAGRLLVRQACMAFDAYRTESEQPRFSRAI
ncbi:oxygen-independent coproporphyrinogen III oxidase [Thalassolituus sp.]|uniref:oxygen-independent coproporphyrinogen III oxidase n=1 Tax=Thalassolituus sp. TaxID=2030822 RepID=UPI003516C668